MRRLITAGLCVLLAACSKGDEQTSLELEVGALVREQFQRKAPPEPPVLTRALLDTVPVPQLEIVIESSGKVDFLVPQHIARGSSEPGRVEVWRTVDNLTFTFRDGMLIATRGLGAVLLSAAVPADGLGAAGPASGGARRYAVRSGDHGKTTLNLGCGLEDLGPQRLEIVEQAYPVRHLQETCEGAGGRVVNDYWIDSRDGRLWQSRQWGGPDLGYIRTRLLHSGLGEHRKPGLMLGN